MSFLRSLLDLLPEKHGSSPKHPGRYQLPVLRLELLEDRSVPSANPIVAENLLPGTPQSQWDIVGAGDPTIQGFATDISVDNGQTVSFKIDSTTVLSYHIVIYRLGYYDGLGAREIATIPSSQVIPTDQPAPLTNPNTGLVDAGNWSVSASWAVPETAVSGIYLAKLVRDDTGGASHVVFVVRDDERGADVLFQTSDTTWAAYNNWGGKSLYDTSSSGAFRAYAVSYNRPLVLRNISGGLGEANSPFWSEYPMVRWLEANGYNVSYTTGVDTDRAGAELLEHKVFLSVGHDEYWSAGQRANVEAAQAAGVHLAFFSGNEMYWKLRWENSIDSSGTPYRTLVCYKESTVWTGSPPENLPPDVQIGYVSGVEDPSSISTGLWRDLRYPDTKVEQLLTGQLPSVNRGMGGYFGTAIQVPAEFSTLRLWRNTSVANLQPGQVKTLSNGTLGYEWDEVVDSGYRPAGLIKLSSTTENVPEKFVDPVSWPGCGGLPTALCSGCRGCAVAPGTATHNLSMYRAPSGALVFGAGTVQWSWGLDGTHDGGASIPDPTMQQATVNVFADMGVQPDSLQSGLVAALASTDLLAPSASITPPANGATFTANTPVTISGTATDVGGGVVAGIEVSVDGGSTWHAASGQTSWSYTWVPTTSGDYTLLARATDDSVNLGTPSPSVAISVQPTPPGTGTGLWDYQTTPAILATSDSSAVEVGMKFQAAVDGTITALRFYKGASNTGTHIGNLWDVAGNLLATATFTNETASGWQQVTLSNPVSVIANTTYIVSYYAPNGRYSLNQNYFATSYSSGSLIALSSGGSGGNGVFRYGNGFPNQSHNASNYWVDVLFSPDTADTIPPTVTATTPLAGGTNVAQGSNVTATFSEAVQAATIVFQLQNSTGTLVNAAVTYDATSRTATLDPTNSLAPSMTYTATISGAKDLAGNTMSQVTWTFTTTAANSGGSLWNNQTSPAILATSDSSAVEVGMKFQAAVDGAITALRFYKGASNTGTHIGHLWDVAGNLLATATFTNETASGWQQVTLSNPVSVNANTTYIVSYYAPNGRYSLNHNYFASSFSNGSLVAPSASAVSGNGVYRYGSGGGFPNQTYNASNYWVDVVFSPGNISDTTPPTVIAKTPLPGGTNVAQGSNVTATFSETVQSATIVFQLQDSTGTLVNAAVTYDAASRTATLDPTNSLAPSMTYTATISGAKDLAGNTMSQVTWTFTTTAANFGGSLWDDQTTPAILATSDSSAVEVGMKFQAAVGGTITALRFYKGASNTGTHIGHLWDVAGNLLATATFTNETASGWQQVTLSNPVSVIANTTYIVSYYAPNGRYSLNQNYFATSYSSGSLIALSSGGSGGNGVFRYGSGGGFPNQTYNASNYWVDVLFSPGNTSDTTPPTVISTTPTPDGVDVSLGLNVAATFSEAVQAATIVFQLQDSTGTLVNAAVTYDAASRTATLDPTNSLAPSMTYTATISGAKDLAGNTMSQVTWTFTTTAATSSGSLWNNQTLPAILATSDSSAVEVGMKFQAAVDGTITALRFYKGASNTGTHIGHLWDVSGNLLATATFTNETTSGWQQVTLSNPVSVNANTTYIVSYYAPNGRYSLNQNYFATSYSNGPLVAPSASAVSGNGVYRYGSGGGFPDQTYNASNYWVDVVFS